MNNIRSQQAFTLTEVLVGASVFFIFLTGVMMLYMQGQGTITKSTWINNAARDETLAARVITEAANASSYPSSILPNLIKTAENNKSYWAQLPAGIGTLATGTDEQTILAFPMCREQSADKPGELRWFCLQLNKSSVEGYLTLDCFETVAKNYNPGAPDYAASMNDGAYIAGMSGFVVSKRKTLLRDIEKVELIYDEDSKNCLRFNYTLSYPRGKEFKKNGAFTIVLNVDCNI